MLGNLIGIVGPAAVGKSTVARFLQAELARDGDLWLILELDAFATSLPRNWIALNGRAGRFAGRGFIYHREGPDRIDLTIGPDGRRFLAAFHRSVAAVLHSGVNVICETIVYDPADWDDWLEALKGAPAWWVKLNAPRGAVSPTATRLRSGAGSPNPATLQAMTARHSARAAERLSR